MGANTEKALYVTCHPVVYLPMSYFVILSWVLCIPEPCEWTLVLAYRVDIAVRSENEIARCFGNKTNPSGNQGKQ